MATDIFDQLLIRLAQDAAFAAAVAADPEATLAGFSLTPAQRRRLATTVQPGAGENLGLAPRLSKSSVLMLSSGGAALAAEHHAQLEGQLPDHPIAHVPSQAIVVAGQNLDPVTMVHHTALGSVLDDRAEVLGDIKHVVADDGRLHHDEGALAQAQSQLQDDQRQIDHVNADLTWWDHQKEWAEHERSDDGGLQGLIVWQLDQAHHIDVDDHMIADADAHLHDLHAALDTAQARLDHDQDTVDSLGDRVAADHTRLENALTNLDQAEVQFQSTGGDLADPAMLEALGQSGNEHALQAVQVDVEHLHADEHRHIGDIQAVDRGAVEADLRHLDADWERLS